METIVIDYGSGNLLSVAKALERAGREAEINGTVTVSQETGAVDRADHIVLPGVGAFGDCANGLRTLPKMVDALERNIRQKKKPFLGICVGMQLMADRGLEHGSHEGLGWIQGVVRPLAPLKSELKIPHMGWNVFETTPASSHPVLSNFVGPTHAYFVHSYSIHCRNDTDVLATSDYGGQFPAVVGKDNMIGTQFHPEKSQTAGLKLLHNFLRWDGEVT
ncbi:MAG: imidazole glycerol phosphate synthase subunit HisH [Pseudomonadota bacterium]|mgnify:CR=1 FL=1|nr:imidazole glycerol phosphate synthase subunit HisH [Alphaproteobacteria bacterium]MEC7942501.1 imidazole glycerol phosphate synthase subunit HisH [Pseudomonadota bacterium]MEC8087576.1 imidazole glycerol phosphate synthase subunit HisH [Pseudomonadota bacterium]MEC8462199.1 imidazole glycerol phosphate synthase subunit HisH [Pseudomonadota bacterium]MEC8530603.1 imidazole glycerol phosphate synthase subunit HisH [Pseudomonadota bacterium]